MKRERKIPTFHLEYVDWIIEEVKAHFPIDEQQLTSRSRRRPEVENRFLVAYLLRHVFGLTMTDIGAIMGRDHTTIVHGLSEAEYWEFNNRARWATLKKVEAELTKKYLSAQNEIQQFAGLAGIRAKLAFLQTVFRGLEQRQKEFEMMLRVFEAEITGASVLSDEKIHYEPEYQNGKIV